MAARTIVLLDNTETAEMLGIRPNTLENWRLKEKGPVFRTIGRKIRYVESDVLNWLDAQAHTSTSQYATSKKRGK